jgi:hypothetical protein
MICKSVYYTGIHYEVILYRRDITEKIVESGVKYHNPNHYTSFRSVHDMWIT